MTCLGVQRSFSAILFDYRDMVRFLLILVVVLASDCGNAFAAQPTFDQYPSGEMFSGPRSPLRLRQKRDKMFRTALSRFENSPIDFAGHYVLATIGCGASCILIAAFDVKTGRVIWAPFNSVCCWEDVEGQPIEFRPDSDLAILSGLLNETGHRGKHYFRIVAGRFVPVPRN